MTRISRRSALIGASSVALGRAVAARAASADVDVVVVGAGSAGLSAARHLLSLGRSVTVLEARDRVGGRAHTDRRLGPGFDAGAHYIHWAESNPWVGLAAELGIETRDSDREPYSGFTILDEGRPLSAAERSRRRRAYAHLEEVLDGGIGEPDRSIAEVAREDDAGSPGISAGLTLLTLGEEPDRVSAADYGQLWSGQDLVVPSGYGSLVERLGAGLPIRLNQPVRSIDWSGPGIRVEARGGSIRARSAVLTVSVGILRHGGLDIRPALPGAVEGALEGLAMGAYTKIALRLGSPSVALPYALDLGREGLMAFDPQGGGSSLVVASLGGDFARRLCEAGEADAVAYARDRLGLVYGAETAGAVTGGTLAGWWADPFARGSYSIARPGRAAARLALRQPIGDRLWLAGEASAGGGAMTVGGAWLDGRRAADEVHRALGRT